MSSLTIFYGCVCVCLNCWYILTIYTCFSCFIVILLMIMILLSPLTIELFEYTDFWFWWLIDIRLIFFLMQSNVFEIIVWWCGNVVHTVFIIVNNCHFVLKNLNILRSCMRVCECGLILYSFVVVAWNLGRWNQVVLCSRSSKTTTTTNSVQFKSQKMRKIPKKKCRNRHSHTHQTVIITIKSTEREKDEKKSSSSSSSSKKSRNTKVFDRVRHIYICMERIKNENNLILCLPPPYISKILRDRKKSQNAENKSIWI